MQILCQKEKCGGIIAQVKGKMIELIRSKNAEKEHRVLVLGNDVSVIASCPRCYEQTSITVEDGKINTQELTIKEDEEPTPSETQPSQPASDNPTTGS